MIGLITTFPDDNDVQKILHTDTFFPAPKYWYFPEEVNEGAFVYVKNSIDLNKNHLDWIYKRSCAVANGDKSRGLGDEQGSLRITIEELTSLGLKAEAVCVKPNTLVVANTYGFHCRNNVTRPVTRRSLHGSVRLEHPFRWNYK